MESDPPEETVSTSLPAADLDVLDLASYKDVVYWTKRAAEMEKLVRSLVESRVTLDEAKKEIMARKKTEALRVQLEATPEENKTNETMAKEQNREDSQRVPGAAEVKAKDQDPEQELQKS